MYAATQQSQVCGKAAVSNIVETRSKKHQRSQIVEVRPSKAARTTTSGRGGNIRNISSQRQTRSDQPQPVQVPPTLAAHGSQPVQAPRPRQAAEMPPPRTKSQRILQKRLSAPITGPGSSKDNNIVLD